MTITLKTDADVQAMRVAGRLASEVLDLLAEHVKPGVTTEALDRIAHDHIVQVQQAVPAPLNYAPPGYTPYPKSICTSINHQVCHGIPNERALKDGDIQPAGSVASQLTLRVTPVGAPGRARVYAVVLPAGAEK